MINFYSAWKYVRDNNLDDSLFFDAFLNVHEESEKLFKEGSEEDVICAIKFLLSIPKDEFIKNIISTREYNAEDIIQFSNFEHAYNGVCSMIKFENKSLSFSELGSKLMHSKLDGACKKYGENHSKVAKSLSFVLFAKNGQTYVKNSVLGDISVSLLKNDKFELALRMLIRNSFISRIILEAKKGNADYMDLSSNCLSEKTQLRRKSNVKQTTELIVKNTSYEPILKNIVW